MHEADHLDRRVETQLIWTWFDLLIILIGFGVIFFLGWSVLGFLLRQIGVDIILTGEPSTAQSLGLAAMEAIALTASVYFLGMRRKGSSWEQIGLKSLDSRWISIAVSISLLAIPITGLFTVLVLQTFDLPFENPQLDFLLPESMSFLGALGLLLLGGIAVPFAEELFFRGILYSWLRRHWSIWPSVIASALIFGLVHLDVAVGVTAFILGIVLGLVYEYSRTLWTSVLIHALNNSLRILLLYILVALDLMPSV